MFEIFYLPPRDEDREAALTERVANLGGRLDCWEDAGPGGMPGICLTYEFDNLVTANKAADTLREIGEFVHGPHKYGP